MMAVPILVERRLRALEERMTALERLPDRMDRLDARMDGLDARMDGLDGRMVRLESGMREFRTEVSDQFAAVRTELVSVDGRLSARIEDSRRETRVLHENVIGRFALLGEGLGTNSHALAGLSSEMRLMFDALSSRLTAIENRLPVPRRRKSTD